MSLVPRWSLVALVAMLVTLLLSANAALAHTDGQVDLAIVSFTAVAEADGLGVGVEIEVVDADSGEPQPGYATTVLASGDRTGPTGSIRMTDLGAGIYRGSVVLGPDRWSLLVRVDQGPGAPAARSVGENFLIEVRPDGSVEVIEGLASSSSDPVRIVAVLLAVIGVIVAVLQVARAKRLEPR